MSPKPPQQEIDQPPPVVLHEWESAFSKAKMRLVGDLARGAPTVMFWRDGEWIATPFEQTAVAARYEFGRLAAEVRAQRERIEALEGVIRDFLSLPQTRPVTGSAVACNVCGQRKAPLGRGVPLGSYLCDRDCPGYAQTPAPGSLWPGESLAEFGYPKDAAEDDADLRLVLSHPIVRELVERERE